MLLLKHFRREEARRRYRSYLNANAVYAVLFFVSFLLGLVLTSAYLLTARGIDSAETFRLHWLSRISAGVWPFCLYGFCSLLPYVLSALVFGITIYAPVCNAISALVSAFLSGAYLRFLLGLLHLHGSLWPFLYYLPAFFLIAVLLLVIYAFSTAVSLKSFTPHLAGRAESEKMFGGTLFCAPYYQKTINLRFLFTYLLCFLLCALLLFGLCALQAVMVLML